MGAFWHLSETTRDVFAPHQSFSISETTHDVCRSGFPARKPPFRQFIAFYTGLELSSSVPHVDNVATLYN